MKNEPSANSDLSTWLVYLEPMRFIKTKDRNLNKVKEVATRLNILKPARKTFLVGGTNGKGSTCKALEKILISNNYKVGTFINPEIFSYTEQLTINGCEVDALDHCHALAVIESVRKEIELTRFEFIFLSILYILNISNLDVVIIEVGMGGSLDPTNILDPDISVITNVDIDHTEWLGVSREEIAKNKLGIARQHKPLIFGDSDIPACFLDMPSTTSPYLYAAGREWDLIESEAHWSWHCKQETISSIPYSSILTKNAATAIAAIKYSKLTVSSENIRTGLSGAEFFGRFSILKRSPHIILDIAHNPHGVTCLKERLTKYLNSIDFSGKVTSIFSTYEGKDISNMIEIIHSLVDRWVFFELNSFRKFSFIESYYSPKHTYVGSAKEALECAINSSTANDIILIFGSSRAASEVYAALMEKEDTTS